jgi:hypothetical protein
MTDQEQIDRAVTKTVQQFQRRGAPADPADMRQEAWQIALTALEGFDPKRGALENYLRRCISRRLGEFVSRSLAAVSITKHAAKEARHYQHRVPLEDAPLVDKTPTPEAALIDSEAQQRRVRVRQEAARLARQLNALPVIERLWGLDGEPAEPPRRVAKRLRVPVDSIYTAQEKFRRMARASQELQRLREG